MKILKLSILLSLILGLISCDHVVVENNEQLDVPYTETTTETSTTIYSEEVVETESETVNWVGTYTGIIGNKTDIDTLETIILQEDQTYIKKDIYLKKVDNNKIKQEEVIDEGIIVFNHKNNNIIQLISNNNEQQKISLQVGYNYIEYVDSYNFNAKTTAEDNYILEKE